MNYLVIDLEMCRVKKLYRKTYKYASEIIQIGAVLLDEGFNRKRGIKDDKNYIRQYMRSVTGSFRKIRYRYYSASYCKMR